MSSDDYARGFAAGIAKALVPIVNEMKFAQERIDRGKGTWPERDYVTDERWARLLERRDTLANVEGTLRALAASTVTVDAGAKKTELREFGLKCVNRATGVRDDFRSHEVLAVVDAVLSSTVTVDTGTGPYKAQTGTEPMPIPQPDAKCETCGAPRTMRLGGTIFTVCDACWDKAWNGTGKAKP